jgi:dipeptidase E
MDSMKKMLLASDLKQVLGKISFLFDKPFDQMKVIYITTATNVYPEENKGWFFEEKKAFRNLGIKLIEYDIKGKSEDSVTELIKDADVVCVTGGNTYYLLEHMQKCNFKSAIVSYLKAGGLYIGCSAGSIVACPTIDFIGDMDDSNEANLTDYSGFGLVPFNIMPHIDHPKFSAKTKELIQKSNNAQIPIIALRDNQAILINDHCIEIL